MEVLSTSLDLRSFQALINGLVKKNFYDQQSFTSEFLREQLYPDSELDQAEIINEISSFEEVLKQAAQENWDASKLNENVKSRTLAVDFSKVIATIWSKESEKINKKCLKESTWNRTLDHLAWRVDVKAISKSSSEIDEPVAFFEFTTKNNTQNSNTKPVNTAKFEMNRDQLADMVKSLADIHKKFEESR